MRFNEERVKLFATILRLMTNPEIIKQLDGDEAFDYEALVRAIAEMVPLPAIDIVAPVICPQPHVFPAPSWPPNWTPMQPLSPTIICANNTAAMLQADGMGDDSGTRGD